MIYEKQATLADVEYTLERVAEAIALGNEGNAEVQELKFNTPKLSYKIKIQHRHVTVVDLGPLLGKKEIVVYSLTTYAEGEVDVLEPDTDDIEFCVKTPGGGKTCATLTDIIKIAALL